MKEADKLAKVESLLGRPLKEVEQRLYNTFKKDKNYYFTKDSFGNLKFMQKPTDEEYEQYAEKLLSILREGNIEIWDQHLNKPEINLTFGVVSGINEKGTFHYMYINSAEEKIRKEIKI